MSVQTQYNKVTELITYYKYNLDSTKLTEINTTFKKSAYSK